MASVSFEVVALDLASRTFRGVGNAALVMAAKVRAANLAMETAWIRNTHAAGAWFKLLQYGAPLVPPLLGAITVALGAMNSAVVSVVPGLGALGLALGGLGIHLLSGAKELKDAKDAVAAATNPKELKEAQERLDAVKQRVFAGPSGDALKGMFAAQDAFKQFSQTAMPVTAPIATEAFKGIQMLLPKLQPMVASFGAVFHRVLADLNEGMQRPGFQKFLDWCTRVGAVNFDHIIRALGNIVLTIARLGMAFSGQGVAFTRWLEDVTGKWARWAGQLESSRGFQNFLDYVRTNGPLVMSVLGNLTTLLGNFIEALAPLGHITLTALDHLTAALAKIPPSYLTAIAGAFLAMKVAMLAVAAAGLVAKAAIIGLRVAVLAARAAVLVWTAAQWLLNAALTANPIGIVVVAIAALVAAFVIAYRKSETFRNIVNNAFAVATAGARTLINTARPVLDWIAHTGFPAAASAARTMRSVMSSVATAIGSAFSGLFHGVLAPIVSLMLRAFASLSDGWASVLRALSHVPGFGWAAGAAQMMQGAAARARELAAGIAALKSKSISVTTTYHNITINSIINKQANDPRGIGQPGAAAGGHQSRNMPVWVGERGPELYVPDVPGTVITAADSHRMLANTRRAPSGGDGGDAVPIELHVHLEGRTIVQTVLAYKRNTAGRSTGIG